MRRWYEQKLILYAADESDWINGQTIAVDNLIFTNKVDLEQEFAWDPIKRQPIAWSK